MARKCKCKICKNQLTTDKAFLVVNDKGKNEYYCTEEEYNNYIKEIKSREECYNYVAEMINAPFLTPMFKKEINKLREYYSYEIIKRTFKDNKDNISWFMNNKAGDNEYGNMRYILSIILNNIQKSAKAFNNEQEKMRLLFEKEEVKDETIETINIMENINKKQDDIKKDVHDISMFLDD